MNFFKKSTINVFASGFLGFINLLAGIIIARSLGPDGVGQYQLVMSSTIIVAALGTFGVGSAIIYFINNKKQNPVEVSTVCCKFSIALGLISLVLLCFTFFVFEGYFGEMSPLAVFAMGSYGAMLVFITAVWPILMADMRVIKYQLVALVPQLGLLILVAISILLFPLNVTLTWLFAGIGQLCGLVLAICFLKKNFDFRLPFNWNLLKGLIAYGLKLNLTYIVRLLNSEIGLLLIRILIVEGFAQVGFYGRAVRLSGMMILFADGIGMPLYAKWSGASSQDKLLQMERTNRVFWAINIIIVCLLVWFARLIVVFLYGEDFLPVVPMMKILAIGMGARFIVLPHLRMFNASGSPLCSSLIMGLNLIVMVVLMLIFVPVYSGLGAAYAATISNLIVLGFSYVIICKKYGVRFHKCLVLTAGDIQYIIKAVKH